MAELVDLSVPGRRSVPEWIGRTPDEPAPPRVRLRVLLRNDRKCASPTCAVPGGRDIRLGRPWCCDHTIAIILGGQNRERNLRPLCEFCTPIKDAEDQAAKSKDADVMKAAYGLKPKSRLSKQHRRAMLRWREQQQRPTNDQT